MGDKDVTSFTEIELAAIRIRLIEAELELNEILIDQEFRNACAGIFNGMFNNNPLLPESVDEEPFFVIYDIDWSKYGRVK